MLLLNMLLTIAWVVLTGQYTVLNAAAGFAVSYGALWLIARGRAGETYFRKVPQVFGFVLYFVWELLVANVRVVISVLGPRANLKPGIVAIPLDVKSDAEITMFANLITLTPGTLSLDVSADRSTLFVHAIHVGDVDEFIRDTKTGFERRVQEVFA